VTPAALTRRFIVLRGIRWLPLGMVLPFIVLLPQARGLGIATIGALWALHSVVVLVLEVPSGALADALGRRRVLLAGAGLMAVALLAYALAETPLTFALALTALATGRAFTSGALEAWYVDELRAFDPAASLTTGLARGTVADGIGLGAGALIGGFLPMVFDGLPDSGSGVIFYTPVALTAAALAAAYLVAVVVLVAEHRPQSSGAPLSERIREVRRTAAENVRSSPTVRTLLTTAAAFGFAVSSVEILWQPRLAELLGDAHDHTVLFGVLVAGAMATVSAGAACTGAVVRALGPRRGYIAIVAASAESVAWWVTRTSDASSPCPSWRTERIDTSCSANALATLASTPALSLTSRLTW